MSLCIGRVDNIRICNFTNTILEKAILTSVVGSKVNTRMVEEMAVQFTLLEEELLSVLASVNLVLTIIKSFGRNMAIGAGLHIR